MTNVSVTGDERVPNWVVKNHPQYQHDVPSFMQKKEDLPKTLGGLNKLEVFKALVAGLSVWFLLAMLIIAI